MIFVMHILCKQKEEGGGDSSMSISSYILILIQFLICSSMITFVFDDLLCFCKTKVRSLLISQPMRGFEKQWLWSLLTIIKDWGRETWFVENIHGWMFYGMHILCKQKEEGGEQFFHVHFILHSHPIPNMLIHYHFCFWWPFALL